MAEDPRTHSTAPASHRALKPADRASWLDLSVELTRLWTEPVLAGVHGLAGANVRILAELADVLMRRLRGQRVELVVDGRAMRGVLELIRLRRSGDRYQGRLVLRDVEWDGLPIEELSALAASVRVDPFPAPRLTVSGIEIVGRASLVPFVAWLGARAPRWTLGVDAAGNVEASRRRGRVAVVGDLVVAEHRLHVSLRSIRWRRLDVGVPRWLRLRRAVALPALPNAMSIVEARRRSRIVEFRLAVPSMSRWLDPVGVR